MAGSFNPVEVELKRIWELTGLRRHDEALAAVSALAVQEPEHPDVLYLQAANLRSLDRVPEALAALDRLERHHPRCGRLHQERGQCYIALRDTRRASAAFSTGLKINPGLPVSLRMLQQLCQAAGDPAGAAQAAQKLAMMGKLPPEVVEASSLFWDGYLLPAESIIREYLGDAVTSIQDPVKVGAMRLLARIDLARGAPEEEIESLLESVLRLAPHMHDARLDYGKVLLVRRKYLRARKEAEKLLRQDPDNREYLKLQGSACLRLGDLEAVVGVNERLLTGLPPSGREVAVLRLWRGYALKVTGRNEEAVADYRAALVAQPDFTAAWFALANLKTYRFTDDEVARMRALEARPGGDSTERSHMCFALGKALEDAGDYAASWQYYAHGNELVRAVSQYRSEVDEDNVRLLRQAYTAEFFADRAGWGDPDPAPVFIVGLPRSGSTLIEQILASHSQVEGTDELSEIGSYVKEFGDSSGPYIEALQRLTATSVRRLGERYLAETHVYRRLGRRFFIDKMPNNFWHIGLVHLMLPNAKIIDARREPMACCFSNMKQLFSETRQEFTYSMDDIARYYRSYLELMRHWKAVLPGRILTVQHEDLVGDLEGNVRRVLEYCALDFEPDCLEFHKTRRSVHSASSEQVRRPINREGLEQWRNYEPWLGPLRAALGDALADYRS